ncbi:hypothetical protein KW803_02820 [Candidatus Saccharibacteria bacterium]|nr:hypothetical protein [Candidatus Saccharibacteria bacterium]
MSETLASTATESIIPGEIKTQSPPMPEFAARPIEEVLDLQAIYKTLYDAGRIKAGQEVYMVGFRSELGAGADTEKLGEADEEALEDAKKSPGYIDYGKGMVDDDGNCISFCIWQSVQAAKDATSGKAHSKAADMAPDSYKWHNLDFLMLSYTPEDGVIISHRHSYFHPHEALEL